MAELKHFIYHLTYKKLFSPNVYNIYFRSLDREKDGRLSKGSAMGIFGIDSGKIRDMQEKDLRRSFENTCKVFCKISYSPKSGLNN